MLKECEIGTVRAVSRDKHEKLFTAYHYFHSISEMLKHGGMVQPELLISGKAQQNKKLVNKKARSSSLSPKDSVLSQTRK